MKIASRVRPRPASSVSKAVATPDERQAPQTASPVSRTPTSSTGQKYLVIALIRSPGATERIELLPSVSTRKGAGSSFSRGASFGSCAMSARTPASTSTALPG